MTTPLPPKIPHRVLAKGLKKSFKGREVVQGVTIEVLTGEVVGLLGPNGAGKTTIFDMVVGLQKPDHGEIFWTGSQSPISPCINGPEGELGIFLKKPPFFGDFPLRTISWPFLKR